MTLFELQYVIYIYISINLETRSTLRCSSTCRHTYIYIHIVYYIGVSVDYTFSGFGAIYCCSGGGLSLGLRCRKRRHVDVSTCSPKTWFCHLVQPGHFPAHIYLKRMISARARQTQTPNSHLMQ